MSEIGKVLCAVVNPSTCKDRGWFYNIFLGNLSKKDKNHEQQKINWLMKLTEREIEILKERECGITILDFNNTVKKTDEYKKGFVALLDLFESLMEDQETKLEIRKLLTNDEGRSSEQYKTIIRTKTHLRGR
jgi:hypothetical protein